MQIQAMPHQARIITAEEFAKIPDDDYRYELVEGRVVRVSPPGSAHGALAVQLATHTAHDCRPSLCFNVGIVVEPELAGVRRGEERAGLLFITVGDEDFHPAKSVERQPVGFAQRLTAQDRGDTRCLEERSNLLGLSLTVGHKDASCLLVHRSPAR
jgi:hypothetical protein